MVGSRNFTYNADFGEEDVDELIEDSVHAFTNQKAI